VAVRLTCTDHRIIEILGLRPRLQYRNVTRGKSFNAAECHLSTTEDHLCKFIALVQLHSNMSITNINLYEINFLNLDNCISQRLCPDLGHRVTRTGS
jgi:hypothetical protein